MPLSVCLALTCLMAWAQYGCWWLLVVVAPPARLHNLLFNCFRNSRHQRGGVQIRTLVLAFWLVLAAVLSFGCLWIKYINIT